MLIAIMPTLSVNLENGRLQKAKPSVRRKIYLWIVNEKIELMLVIYCTKVKKTM
jgi:hypothetical protein